MGTPEKDPNVDPTVAKPKPEPKVKDPSATSYSLLNDPGMDKIKFDVLNLAHFYQNKEGLVDYVKQYKPTTIVLDYCHTRDSEVANVLTESGILSRMFVEHDRTYIIGANDRWVEMDKEQENLIDKVSLKLKHKGPAEKIDLIIYGFHGGGKTLMGCEGVKMIAANIKMTGAICELIFCDISLNGANDTELLNVIQGDLLKYEDYCTKTRLTWQTVNELFKKNNLAPTDDDEYDPTLYLPRLCKYYNDQYAIDGKIKILFIDEVEWRVPGLGKDLSSYPGIDLSQYKHVYTVICISPTVVQSRREGGAVQKTMESSQKHFGNKRNTHENSAVQAIKGFTIDPQNNSAQKRCPSLIVAHLKKSHRNCKEIQTLYNVLLSHAEEMQYDESAYNRYLLCGHLEPPSKTTSTDGTELDNLPRGEMPTLFLLPKNKLKSNYPMEFINEQAVKDLTTDITANLGVVSDSISFLCMHFKKNCDLCISIEQCYDDNTHKTNRLKRVPNVEGFWPTHQFKGCENDVIVVHLNSYRSLEFTRLFEAISRARKRLYIMAFKEDVEQKQEIFRLLREMTTHKTDCNVKQCKWKREKVLNVEEIQ